MSDVESTPAASPAEPRESELSADALAMRSVIFRHERKSSWQELEALLNRIEKSGLRSLSTHDLVRLPNLYRSTVSSLSVARSISLDRNLLDYLEALSARAYFYVYGPRKPFGPLLVAFFASGLPNAVRAQRWPVAIVALVLVASAVAAYMLTKSDVSWYSMLMPDSMAGGRDIASSRAELRSTLYPSTPVLEQSWQVFSSFLFTNNTRVSFLMFALGFALTAPTFLLVVHNGMILGAFIALFDNHGLLIDVLAWLSIHGITEMSAIVLAAAAGVRLGMTILFPGKHTRVDALAREGPLAAQAAIGAMLMLISAAILEGFFRSWVQDITARFVIGFVAGGLWLAYFSLAGRTNRDREHSDRDTRP